jgi:hypothetical protein
MSLIKIINLVLAVILIICAWQGYKKGIIMGIIDILVIILSLYGAQLLSDTFSYEVIPVIKPFVSGYMDAQVEETAYQVLGYEPDENGDYDVPYSLADLMDSQPEARVEIARWAYRNLGIYDDVADVMAEKVDTYAKQNNASLSSSIDTILCQSISWYGGFVLFFIIVYAILSVIVNLPNLSFRLPYVGILNNLVGLGIGIFVGCLFCAVIVWVLQFTGLLLPENTLRLSGLASHFLDKNMLANYISF